MTMASAMTPWMQTGTGPSEEIRWQADARLRGKPCQFGGPNTDIRSES